MFFLFYNSFMKNTLEKYTENVENIIECLGGRENIASVSNCMTRLRVVVRSDSSVEDQKLEHLPDVLGLVHDRPLSYEIVVGPGKCRKYADICREMDLLFFGSTSGENVPNKNTIKSSLKILGDISFPLSPELFPQDCVRDLHPLFPRPFRIMPTTNSGILFTIFFPL